MEAGELFLGAVLSKAPHAAHEALLTLLPLPEAKQGIETTRGNHPGPGLIRMWGTGCPEIPSQTLGTSLSFSYPNPEITSHRGRCLSRVDGATPWGAPMCARLAPAPPARTFTEKNRGARTPAKGVLRPGIPVWLVNLTGESPILRQGAHSLRQPLARPRRGQVGARRRALSKSGAVNPMSEA
ncbi:hypothetical protein PCASD_16675 [Puccinia coronata f. sp. avenae]|uniref:Uncharacterized protein n=1 Tax=Puccinia coronata f. sp. avenae TaxID=200324 RepID=A0A2N5T4S8_9BASI|nr:hypothetical protein PCASD_16675 [Puccinia coronata f. sp. avenae]